MQGYRRTSEGGRWVSQAGSVPAVGPGAQLGLCVPTLLIWDPQGQRGAAGDWPGGGHPSRQTAFIRTQLPARARPLGQAPTLTILLHW